ncbi:MAG: hypothetical protein JXR34_06650 [Bacteroidales bacterium]|nr:hypothetical protein [Bacteroidales bacterium]
MKNFKIVLLMLISISLTTWSCKKDNDDDDDTNPTPTNQTCFFNKVDFGDYYMLVEYNADHQVTKFTEYDSIGTTDGTYTQFAYSNGKLSTFENYTSGTLDAKFEFKYSSNTHPDSAIIYADNNGTLERQAAYKLTFSGDDLVKAEMGMVLMGFPIILMEQTFTYNNGNLVEVVNKQFDMTSLSLKLTGTTSLEYDTKKNPYRNIGVNYMAFMDGRFGSNNNPSKITEKDENGSVVNDLSENIVMEYNSNNYPTKITRTSFDNSYSDVEVYSYNCQ